MRAVAPLEMCIPEAGKLAVKRRLIVGSWLYGDVVIYFRCHLGFVIYNLS